MAAGVPVVSSDRGGLVDIIKHMDNGLTTHAGDPGSMAWGILQLLNAPELSQSVKLSARQDVTKNYTWQAIARLSAATYEQAMASHVAAPARVAYLPIRPDSNVA